MRDCGGMPVKEGNLIQIKIGNEWIVGFVHKLEEGGVLVPNMTQKGVTPDKIILLMEIVLADAPPGVNHGIVRRLCNPDKEVIIPVSQRGD